MEAASKLTKQLQDEIDDLKTDGPPKKEGQAQAGAGQEGVQDLQAQGWSSGTRRRRASSAKSTTPNYNWNCSKREICQELGPADSRPCASMEEDRFELQSPQRPAHEASGPGAHACADDRGASFQDYVTNYIGPPKKSWMVVGLAGSAWCDERRLRSTTWGGPVLKRLALLPAQL